MSSPQKVINEKSEYHSDVDEIAGEGPRATGGTMRARDDELGIIAALIKHKRVVMIAMVAAFSAALDGYQISLNGGIVSNRGFIRQMAGAGTTILDSKYISAWGGIQSAGQTLGQIFLQYGTDGLGRKAALLILWAFLTASIFAETFAHHWSHWLVAKLLSGAGVGMLQATVPVYLTELSPTQVRGMLINAYSFWFIVGQLAGAIALNRLNANDPFNFKTPIYTQWAMIGAMLAIYLWLPESPWWLVGKGKTDKAAKVLNYVNKGIPGYSAHEAINVMQNTIEEEAYTAKKNSQHGALAVFKGRNFIRFIIASWPKVTQQFVGLSVFNTYSTYFFQYAGNRDPFLVTVILTSVQLFSMLVTVAASDKVGRRPLTVYPYGVTVLSVLSLGIVGCFDYTTPQLSSLLVFFASLATFSTTGASAIGYAYAAEIPAQYLRAQTAGWALAFSNLIAIMFSFCTPLMIKGRAAWGVKTGFFFAASGAVATLVAWFILPEVTRRTAAEIDEMFEKKVPLRKFKGYVTEVQTTATQQHEKEDRTTGA